MIVGPDGMRFLTFTEWVEKSKAEQRRADAAVERVGEQSLVLAERQRSRLKTSTNAPNAAEVRAQRLAAKLRELGIEPEPE